MCNLYSITKGQQAIRDLTDAMSEFANSSRMRFLALGPEGGRFSMEKMTQRGQRSFPI